MTVPYRFGARPAALLVLGQNGSALRILSRTLALAFSIETGVLAGATVMATPRLDGIVIDTCGLGDDAVMHKAAEVLHPFLLRELPVLAVASDPGGTEAVRARVLGASAVLPASLPARALTQRIQRLLHMEPSSATNPDQLLQDIAFTLDDLMRSAVRGVAPATDLVQQAIADMRQAMQVDGVVRWLERVRTIHDRTYRHSLLVAGLMAGFAQSYLFPEVDTTTLLTGALLHDIGKALIPTEIIDKPGRLTDAEMTHMRQHAALGHDLLTVGRGYAPTVLSIVRSHHEYLDGSGYPDRLRATDIPDAVRIATLCDVFAALIEERSYKPALTSIQAYEQMTLMSGKLDADLMRAFQAVFVR